MKPSNGAYLGVYVNQMPPMPDGAREGILQGLYRYQEAPDGVPARAAVLFSGPSHLAAAEARTELAERWGVGVELWMLENVNTGERVFVDREEYKTVFGGERPATLNTPISPSSP